MASVPPDTTIKEYQKFIDEVYGIPNDRQFTVWDMLINIQRFIMRGLKGIRKKDSEKTKFNLLISLSWLMSLMNQLHIDLEEQVWKRFPYLCSYCGMCPCVCKEKKIKRRKRNIGGWKKRPRSLEGFQMMFNKIYPAEKRTLEHAGIHLGEEIGEFSEAVLASRGNRNEKDLDNIAQEAADLFSCFAGVFNSLDINIAKELSVMFSHNCHICKKIPCQCSFKDIINFKS